MAKTQSYFFPRLPANITCKAKLTEGGMGRIYLVQFTNAPGQDEPSELFVAKMMLSTSMNDREKIRRFKQEAELLHALKHKNIVPVVETHDLGTPNGVILMPFYSQGSLRDYMSKNGPLSLCKAIKLIIQVTNALHHIHRKGVIHRDVKPENILMDDEQNPILTDFGIAKILGEELHYSTRNHTKCGTDLYVAPEQDLGMRAAFDCDVYSLGITFAELLLGGVPCFDADNQIQEVLPANTPFHSEVQKLIENMTAFKYKERISSMAEVKNQLRLIQRKLALMLPN